MTIEKFIERHGIEFTYVKADSNPHWTGDDKAAHWRYTLKVGTREMSGIISKGSGNRIWKVSGWTGYDRPKGYRKGQRAQVPWNPSRYDREAFDAWTEPEPPYAAEVLDCLASDVSSADQSFEDWCSDFGYDTDSRKAEQTYNACREEMYQLRKLLGARDLEVLLSEVERM